MPFFKWSKTASANAGSDNTINWAEGMAPSAVNDSARAMMARTAEWRDDISGALVTDGVASAYTIFSNQGFDTLANMNGAMIAFTPHVENAQSATLNVDGLGAKPLRAAPSVDIQSNVLIAGTPYVASYFHSTGEWLLHGLGGNAYGIPLGAGFDYWGDTTPSSAFAFPLGQAISRTTYAKLFALFGTKYGAGDGSTTFNLPDKTGRVSVMKEATATRLTSSYFGGDSTQLGATGGNESKALITDNLPPYTPAGTITNGAITSQLQGNGNPLANILGSGGGNTQGGVGSQSTVINAVQGGVVSTQAASTFAGTAQGGTSTPFSVCQPTIVSGYIVRII